jgi:hypothetical protein
MSEAAVDLSAAAPPALSVYAFRRSVVEKERTFTLHPDAIVITTPGLKDARIPLVAVRKVHLHFHRTKQRDYYQCSLKLEDGRTLLLQDQHWKGFADFESRSATFTPFIRALHEALLPYRDNIRFESGSLGAFIGALIMTPVTVGLLLVALWAGLWLVALGLAAVVLSLLPIVPRSRPRPYQPGSPPEKLLP